MKDARAVLNVSLDATADEITLAYRRAAMRWHPDRNDGAPEAKARFQEIQTAYQYLLKHAAAAGARPPPRRESARARAAELDENAYWDESDWGSPAAGAREEEKEDGTFAGNWRGDIPYMTLLTLAGGVIALAALPLVFGVICLTMALALSSRVYRRPRSESGFKAKRIFRICVGVYFAFLLLAIFAELTGDVISQFLKLAEAALQ